MDIDKLQKWDDLLLDTGKRNNLINFRESKMGTVEVVSPDIGSLFSKALNSAAFEVFDPKSEDDDELPDDDDEDNECKLKEKRLSKQEYIRLYDNRLKKHGQILIYNSFVNPIRALKNIGKKSKTAIEETGVNIAYMAFGFVNWKENDTSNYVMHAPLLLVPITIENESSIEPFYVKVTDDDIIVNPTFSFKLQTDYGIKLPEYADESIEEYLSKVERLTSKLRWTVSSECKIGIFSFLKINMYKDLKDNAPIILKNENVRTLLGEEVAQPESGNIEITATCNDLSELHNVVDSDSSQSDAIEMAHLGKSFVLQGPPGTGKSQTITNIIAECLYDGKKVLFVSEKLAALNVVYDKLKKVGLEEFCLELHSHKANKKDIISDLCRTLKLSKSGISERAERELEAKRCAQRELDEYATELHKNRPVINKTLYQLYEKIASYRNAPDIEFAILNIKDKGEEYFDKAISSLTHFEKYIPSIGYDYHLNFWYGYKNPDCSYQAIAKMKSDLQNMIRLCSDILSINEKINSRYAIKAQNIEQAYALRDFFNLVKSSDFITPDLLNMTALAKVKVNSQKMKELAKEIFDHKEIIGERFDDDIFKLDGKNLHKKLTKQYCSLFSRLFGKEYKHIIGEIKLCAKNGKKLKYADAVSATEVLSDYQQKYRDFDAVEEETSIFLGSAYNGIDTDFDTLTNDIAVIEKILEANIDFGKMYSLSKSDFVANKKSFSEISDLLNSSCFETSENEIFSDFDVAEYNIRFSSLSELLKKLQGCFDNIDKIDNWCEFYKLLRTISDLDLRSFIDCCIAKRIPEEEFSFAYAKAFYTQWVDAILHESPILISLSRIPHDEIVKQFKEKDKLNFEINKAKIKAKLSAQRPNLDMIAQGSSISILLREGEKKRKQKGIRALFEEIGDLAQTLKPCFLMSPLSVSTFLSPHMIFDVVVFDEASQIFPQDAIGAIYRGKQLIVVGDSKQMPPSNFFNSISTSDDDDESDDVTDFESILDLCSTTLPQKRLKWHYRSRFEQLISFSNKNFYENDLITFPSSKQDRRGIGVDYFYVNGTFDRKSKTNRAEAEYIVDLVFEHIEKYPDRSLGVVAFSISQQTLIDRLISKRRQEDPSKDSFFKENKPEPFFVKNLETVQGDERDTIIFSIAYGKDSEGRLLLNFGPINRVGGERRLNVAVTRAKYNVQLVSSMHYGDIDLSRTSSVGARLLREYLDYAENGEIALKRSLTVNPFEKYDSEFEMEVCDFLRENGFCVDTQVGCSSFRIDLAIKHPNSSDYVLAVECDGASYHSSKTARDRDRLRQEILENMGWKFYRIWSTDWFRNKSTEKDKLLLAAKNAVENFKTTGAKVEQPQKIFSFEEVASVKHFQFPKYIMVDELQTVRSCNYNIVQICKAILDVEAPLSEEWLLRRIAFMFGREKVTNVVRNEFNRYMWNCEKAGIIRQNGFLYLQGKDIPMLRVPQDNASVIRGISCIAIEELALGMKAVLEQNINVEKIGLFKLISQQLGFNRMGDAIFERLELALKSISNDIETNGEMLSLK